MITPPGACGIIPFSSSQCDPVCVNGSAKTVTATWVERECATRQVCVQQETILRTQLDTWSLIMKTLTKFAAGALLALSVAAPAFAADPESQTLQERNTYLYTSDARPIVQHQQDFTVRSHRGVDALAFAPDHAYGSSIPAAGPTRDLGIGSQS
jgi:hypothetical protein